PTRSQWKAFIDPRQGLPVRIELSKRADENLPWEPEMTIRLSYPTTAEVEGELKAKLPPE
ncbi:MAG: hypothetical protein ACM3VT_18880, partial [Solirubrobacterales bacterium]